MTLAPGDLARLSALLEEALDLPAPQRAAWLEGLAPEVQDLRPLLHRLLLEQADARTHDLLAGLPALVQLVADQKLMPEPEAGRQLGPYRLLRLLGRGGMGAVWLAERVDGSFKRDVALKLPFSDLPQARLVERFARERDILAALEHRHIARLYDAGVTAQGQPYLALEYVVGKTVTEHADAAGLSPRARVLLFMQVLQGVQYAHSRLVVHRDLKPSNILVTAEGQVQLLDFGIATLLADDGGGLALAEFGANALTPGYASPEQVAGQAVGTASDVYSLGVVFQELLGGSRPCAPASAPALRGDLDAIAQRALQKAPAERYATAESFAQDLQRWLDGAPVLAHPDSLAYRARKFVLRYKLPVAALALAITSLSAGLVVALRQTQLARAQTALAQREASKALAVQGFVVDLFNEADPVRAQGRELTVRDLMSRGERTLQARLAGEPDVSLTMSGVLADIYHRLGDDPKALPLATSRRDTALKLHGAHSLEYGDALLALGTLQGELDERASALATLEQARAVLAEHGDVRKRELLDIPGRVADSLIAMRRNGEARDQLQKVLPAVQAEFGPNAWEVVGIWQRLALTWAQEGQHARAAEVYAEIEPLLDKPPPGSELEAASIRGNMGYTQWLAGQWPQAIRSTQRANHDQERLLGPNNTRTLQGLSTLIAIQADAGDYRAALASYEDLASRAVQLYGRDKPAELMNRSYGMPVLVWTDHLAQAEAIGRDTVRIAEADPGFQPFVLRLFKRRLALALLANGKGAEALGVLQAISTQELADKDPRHGLTLLYMAGALTAQGRLADAAAAAHDAGDMLGKDPLFINKVWSAKARLTEALARARQGDAVRARALAAEGEALFTKILPAGHANFELAKLAQAAALEAAGGRDEARRQAQAARERFHALTGATVPRDLVLVF